MTPDRGVAPHQLEKIVCPSTSLKRVSGTATRGINNKCKLTTPLPQKPPTSKPYIPPKLGKSVERLAVRGNTVGIFQACLEARVPNELNQLPQSPHTAATLFNHMRVHAVPIKVERGMTAQKLTKEIKYGAHSSATKETTFVRTDLEEQAISPSFP